MFETTTTEIIEGPVYDIHKQDCYINGQDLVKMEVAKTKDGYRIGDVKTADYLTKELGLTQLQPAKEGQNSCSIGFCPKDNKWYGWSHRAIHGFGVGSEVMQGDCAYKPRNVVDWIAQTLRWHSDDETFSSLGRIKSFSWDESSKTLSITKHNSQLVVNEVFDYAFLGDGEWRAGNLDHAKQMAIDFAESVSSDDTLGELKLDADKPVNYNFLSTLNDKAENLWIRFGTDEKGEKLFINVPDYVAMQREYGEGFPLSWTNEMFVQRFGRMSNQTLKNILFQKGFYTQLEVPTRKIQKSPPQNPQKIRINLYESVSAKPEASQELVIEGSAECVNRVLALLGMVQYNGNVGHSGIFGISWDGDGNDKINIKGLPKNKENDKGYNECSGYGAYVEFVGERGTFFVLSNTREVTSKRVWPKD